MRTYTILLVALLMLGGCESFVEVELPDSQLTGPVVFEDRNTANAALLNVYSKLRDGGFLTGSGLGSPMLMGLYTDELDFYGAVGTPLEPFYSNSLLPSTSGVMQLWSASYHQIYCANAILYGVENSAELTDGDRDQFAGEALFVRALVHFYLVNSFGDVPYITTTDHEINRVAPKVPAGDVYNNIVADLQQAIDLLPQEYLSADRVRPNKSAARALLARTYLYMGQWAEAANEASGVLNNSEYVWETDLNETFLKSSTATIWQLSPRLPGLNTNEGSGFIFAQGPPSTAALNAGFVDSFEPGDLRRQHWIRTITNSNQTWYHSYKYKKNSNTGTSQEHSILFRMAEMHLIRAEARARQGELSSALDDVNLIRTRAGLPNSPATTSEQIVAAVMEERRHELFTEYGHRFFDLKRTGQADAVLAPVKPGWNSADKLWPIPELELLANPNLSPQNPGY